MCYLFINKPIFVRLKYKIMRITTQFINFFLLITLIACNNSSGIFSSSTVKGSGNVITESRDASQDFSKVAAKGSVNLFLKKGDFQKIEVEAEDKIMPLVVVEINKGVLTARSEERRVGNEGR